MNKPQMQAKQHTKMNPNEAAAALAMATYISQRLMPQAPQQNPEQPTGASQNAPQTLQNAPESTEATEPNEVATQESPKEENQEIQKLNKDLDEFKGKIEGMIETKFNDLTKIIKDAVSE